MRLRAGRRAGCGPAGFGASYGPCSSTHPSPSPTPPQLPLADVFKLDVSGMRTMDDYLSILSRKGRWNFKDRQRK
jgi:hypothetical protein